jgi:amidohydrolase
MKARRRLVALATGLVLAASVVDAQLLEQGPRPATAALVEDWLAAQLPALLETYRHLHAHPELSLQESETAALVAGRLTEAGYTVTTGVGGHGVVGVLENGSGPRLLLRGDTDGLPVTEDTGLSYASRVRVPRDDGSTTGVMHACGHDLHVTNLLGVAQLLAAQRQLWSGTLLVVAQPAEEVGAGAKAMIEDGFEERFGRPDYAISLHAEAALPAGQVATTSGFTAANVDSVDITIFGRGGHGARPHQTVDPIVTAAYTITALQTLVSRRVDPLERAVVTVGSIHGGFKHNVIPDDVHLQLTVRSYTDAVRDTLLEGIRQIAVDTCQSFRCPQPPKVVVKEAYTPAAYNDPELTRAATGLFRSLLGEGNVREWPPSMGGEDFGRYARHFGIPGLQFRLGTVAPKQFEQSRREGGEPLPSLHSSRYAPLPEPTLATGIRATSHLVMALLPPVD